jgi:RNA polymerase sigma-70 factor (ECF subfamily)
MRALTPRAGEPRSERLSFNEAYARHAREVLHWALRFTAGDVSQAEDLTQDVFVKLHQCLPDLETKESLGGWLYRVTANLAVSSLRRERALFHRLKTVFQSDAAPPQRPDELFNQRESAKAGMAAMGQLPVQERVVLWMKLIDGKSQREIASALEVSEGQISKLVARGVKVLRSKGWEVGDDP